MNKPLFAFQVFAALACLGFTVQNAVRGFWPFAVMMLVFTVLNAYNAYGNYRKGRP